MGVFLESYTDPKSCYKKILLVQRFLVDIELCLIFLWDGKQR